MGRLVDAVAGGVWVDDWAYAQRVLRGGREIPWLDAAELSSFSRQARGLLRSDVVAVPVAAAIAAWLETRPEAREEMAGKSRAGFALKKLLGNEALRAFAADAARALRETHAGAPFALVVPAPAVWAGAAHVAANGGDVPGIDADTEESAATYVADWLRTFADAAFDGVLVDDRRRAATPGDLAACAPIVNVAAHYRWDLGAETAAGGAPGDGWSFHVSPRPPGPLPSGIVLPDAFWAGDAPPERPAGGFHLARVPEDAEPERVLDRLGVLGDPSS